MAERESPFLPTRMMFMGESSLTDGFRLIGFEAWADPTKEEVEKMVRELINSRQNAFLVIDQQLADARIPALEQVRAEGGRIVAVTVPSLSDPEHFHSAVNSQIQRLLGNHSGEQRNRREPG